MQWYRLRKMISVKISCSWLHYNEFGFIPIILDTIQRSLFPYNDLGYNPVTSFLTWLSFMIITMKARFPYDLGLDKLIVDDLGYKGTILMTTAWSWMHYNNLGMIAMALDSPQWSGLQCNHTGFIAMLLHTVQSIHPHINTAILAVKRWSRVQNNDPGWSIMIG